MKRTFAFCGAATALVVAAVILVSQPVGVWADEALLIHAHAHNDYEHPRPLLDALEQGFHSVESDVWLDEGEIMVAHDRPDSLEGYKGSLVELYLDPLQARVDEKGSVYGDDEPLYLWIDIKDSRPVIMPVLHSTLENYSMLSRYSDEEIDQRPVTVILTGDHERKQGMTDRYEYRPYCRDSNSFREDDPMADHRWRWYALNWNSYFDWRGDEPMPPETREELTSLVYQIHAKGRKVRFYATPETPLYWQAALDAQVDLINTDLLVDLHLFLTQEASTGEVEP